MYFVLNQYQFSHEDNEDHELLFLKSIVDKGGLP